MPLLHLRVREAGFETARGEREVKIAFRILISGWGIVFVSAVLGFSIRPLPPLMLVILRFIFPLFFGIVMLSTFLYGIIVLYRAGMSTAEKGDGRNRKP